MVLDNLSSHKVAGVEKAIIAIGAAVLYLPPDSPDLNPIEKSFSAGGPSSYQQATVLFAAP